MTTLSRPFAARTAGVLITFEGPDGSGKSTQIERLAERLRAASVAVELTREPKGTALGEAIFGLHSLRPEPLAELFLMLAQRAQHVAEKIRPWLDVGRVVLCDRFIDASVAYQGDGRGLGSRLVQTLNAHAAGDMVPDLTLLLDVGAVDAGHRRGPARHPRAPAVRRRHRHHLRTRGLPRGADRSRPVRVRASGGVRRRRPGACRRPGARDAAQSRLLPRVHPPG